MQTEHEIKEIKSKPKHGAKNVFKAYGGKGDLY